MRTILLMFLSASICAADTLTHYAYPGDSGGDSQSTAGQGAFSFDTAPGSLVPMRSAALTPAAAAKYSVSPGQSFSITAANGSAYNLEYDDVVPTGGPGQQPVGAVVTDVYDPQNALGGGNNFSSQITSANNGPVLFGSGITNATIGGANSAVPSFTHSQLPPIVSTLLSKFQNAGQSWLTTIQKAASSLFWLLALISLAITGVWMALKHADLMEICAELVRYILFTGFFWWLLTTGPDLAGKIIASLWQLSGQASGTGNNIFPGDIVGLGIQIFQNSILHINWFMPETVVIPVLIALIIMLACVWIAAHVVVMLVGAWVVLFAGLIFLGFGGCRWTSDLAINYYRAILGIGVSLMTMLLIVGIGINFLQNLVQLAGQTPDIPSLAALMCATVLLAFIMHKLPAMVAGIATGGGGHHGLGGVSILSLLGAGVAGASMARGIAAAATGGAGAVAAGSMTAHQKLLDRISVGEAAQAAGGSNGVTSADFKLPTTEASSGGSGGNPELVRVELHWRPRRLARNCEQWE
jgi:P-type conjugative transfer protein TrbL